MLKTLSRHRFVALRSRRQLSLRIAMPFGYFLPAAGSAREYYNLPFLSHLRSLTSTARRFNEEKNSHEEKNSDAAISETHAADQEKGNNTEDVAPADDFLTTIFDSMEPYIDTYEVYKQLTRAGFTAEQSNEIIDLLVYQLNTKLSKLSTKYSQIYELENEQYLFESAQQELRVDITRNREQHINDAVTKINALETDYEVISDELNNHFIQMKNDVQVAINDQKSDNTLKSKKIMLRIQETNHKITTELNMAMRSEIESLRWHLSRWGLIAIMASVCASSVTIYVYRIKKERANSANNEFVPLVIYEPSEFDEDDYHADLDPNAI